MDLRGLDNFPAHLSLKSGPGDIVAEYDGLRKIRDVMVELDVQESGEEYFCQGEVTADVQLECSRCLKEFDCVVRNRTDFIACPESLYTNRSARAIDDEDYVFFQESPLWADISEIVRQAIILAVGLKPLCTDDCRGLCPTCGINLNRQSCDCTVESTDPRWEALKKLRHN